MSDSSPSIIETRRDQILPHLDATDIERAWRFGEVRRFAAGEALATIGEVGVGLAIVLSGQVDVYRYDAHGRRQHFYTFGPGAFLGELAQLAGRPSFGDADSHRAGRGADLFARPDAGSADRRSRAWRTADARADLAPHANAPSRRRRTGDRRPRRKSRRAAARGLSRAQRHAAHDGSIPTPIPRRKR